jgi:hypothetical protein
MKNLAFIILVLIAICIMAASAQEQTESKLDSRSDTSSITKNLDAVINDLFNISTTAYQNCVRPVSKDGGGGSYAGYKIPSELKKNKNGKYTAKVAASKITFVGTSVKGYGTVTVTCDSTGRLYHFTYTGKFKD